MSLKTITLDRLKETPCQMRHYKVLTGTFKTREMSNSSSVKVIILKISFVLFGGTNGDKL